VWFDLLGLRMILVLKQDRHAPNGAPPAMAEDTATLPGLSPVGSKPLQVAFDGGRLSSDFGVVLLGDIDRHLKLSGRLASC